ncbi:DEKNAAC101982 [Brettanomyces naardenensis]|uniref:General transcription and DNA repair factor IIH subunit TFB4 n=1 Tax=Brettanomyces naardenensis TaxID=13370 RepID=A0A448YJA9_BRENA|nr:DEKNAAC101982 [Brettanomyces naardenensis]
MDAIADRAFVEISGGSNSLHRVVDETPSLLSVILDVNPLEWKKLIDSHTLNFREVASAVLVMLNSHLALNSGNEVALYIANSYFHGARLIYPSFEDEVDDNAEKKANKRRKINANTILKTTGIYRQFRIIDETIVDRLDQLIKEEPERLKGLLNKGNTHIKGTLSGALSQSLSYINRLQTSDEHAGLKGRVLCISVSGDTALPYVSIMNSIFAAQKQKVSVDVCKLGPDSTFLQQASDATNGAYIYIKNPVGLIQYLSTALFIDPMLRPIVVLPTNTSIDFRASCFITSKVVDIGYVCSVCLCILSVIPSDEKCPTCHSKFDHNLITQLKRKPKVLPLMKRKPKAKKKNEDTGKKN